MTASAIAPTALSPRPHPGQLTLTPWKDCTAFRRCHDNGRKLREGSFRMKQEWRRLTSYKSRTRHLHKSASSVSLPLHRTSDDSISGEPAQLWHGCTKIECTLVTTALEAPRPTMPYPMPGIAKIPRSKSRSMEQRGWFARIWPMLWLHCEIPRPAYSGLMLSAYISIDTERNSAEN